MADARVLKTPVVSTKFCWVQGEGYQFNEADPAVYKFTGIAEGADAEFLKREFDQAVVDLVDGEFGTDYGTGEALPHPVYKFNPNTGTIEFKAKVKIHGTKRDGTEFTRTLPVIDQTNKPVEATVGSGSRIQAALRLSGWKGFGKIGLSVQPVAIMVHEANQGGANGPRTRRSNDEWGDFFGAGVDASASPATAGAPVEEDDI